jgi:serine/threonine protein kinase
MGVSRVSRGGLGPLKELAEGGYGKVYHAVNYRLGSDPSAIAFKEFTSQAAVQGQAAEEAVSFRDGLSQADRDDLDRSTVWPRAVVEDQGAIVGLLMPLISKEFFVSGSGQAAGKLRELQWLIAAPALLAQNGIADFDETDRLVLLAQLVYNVARLHRHGWVFGDLSFKNAAFAVGPPRMILLDCDGAASLRNTSRSQGHSLGWAPPNYPPNILQDKESDVYKLALAILRCLNPGKGAATMRDPARLAGKLAPAGATLITKALDDDPTQRPTAKELYGYLRRLVISLNSPPDFVFARLATPLRVRGMDARVEWDIANVSEVTIKVGSSATMTVPVTSAGPMSHVFPARLSGPVTIEAKNRHGGVRADLGELTLYEIPPFDPMSYVGKLPRLAVPPIEAFTLDSLDAAIATMPRIAAPELPPVPAVPTGDLTTVLRETLQPAGGIAQSLRFPNLSELVAGPTRDIANLMTSQARSFAMAQRASYLNAPADTEEDDE